MTNFQKEIEKSINIDKPDFVAIDFEHATRNKGTVCSVGIVSFKNDEIIDEYYTLIKPPNNEFEWFTTKKHHLNYLDTEQAPSFFEIFPEIEKRLKNNKVIAHGAFHTDKHCLEQAMELNDITNDLNIRWDCTQNITNSKLSVAAKVCNIDLDHHLALSDAKTCGIIYSMHLKNKLPLDEIRIENKKQKPENDSNNNFFPESLKGEVLIPDFEHAKNKSNPFFMKKVVITGFDIELKNQIADELKLFGADIDTTVGSNTNFLIIGENAGPSKLEKMNKNIDLGKDATILDFTGYEKIINNYR